ncbi:hypothetical protein [Candidatus Magnetaquicoccus inordinatus]|uniref:hypothetical protein n=1 Tax=Candidatus Magnetaquicoccus inordinatus TaxID=2496818 RepID=UPI00187D2AA9|nr:hypothetical protein [Candidatus Magnetaquicoccus inordinatus]
MFRKSTAFAALIACSLPFISGKQALSAPPANDTDFQNEIRLSCEKYAKEDQIPAKEIKEYIALCIRDFSEAQPTDEFPPFESEEGIHSTPLSGDYNPLEKSQEMEKARPIDPPVKSAPATGKPVAPNAPAAAKPAAATPPAKPGAQPADGKKPSAQ